MPALPLDSVDWERMSLADDELRGQAHAEASEDPVPHAVFSLDGVDDRERFDLWRESISCIFEVEADREVRDRTFNATVDANMFGPVMLARTQTLRQDWIRTPGVMAADGMDHYMVQLYESGEMLWETSKGSFSFPENGLVVFDLSREVSLKTNDFANISLIIPRDMLESQIKFENDQHLRILRGSEPMVQLLRDHMMSLKRLSSQMSARQAVEIAPATIGLTAACLNAAVSDAPQQQAGLSLAQMSVIRRLIERNLSNPSMSAEWITARAGMSRAKLYQLFEPLGGVANYVRERRLRRGLLALADGNARHRSIFDIALDSGYSTDTAFSRAFKARYGFSPSEIRRGEAVRGNRMTNPDSVDRRYEHWLHHLSV